MSEDQLGALIHECLKNKRTHKMNQKKWYEYMTCRVPSCALW